MKTPPNELDCLEYTPDHNPNQSENKPMDASAEQRVPDRKRPQFKDPEGVIVGRAFRLQIIDGMRSWGSLVFPR
jgi:hypothetical protein